MNSTAPAAIARLRAILKTSEEADASQCFNMVEVDPDDLRVLLDLTHKDVEARIASLLLDLSHKDEIVVNVDEFDVEAQIASMGKWFDSAWRVKRYDDTREKIALNNYVGDLLDVSIDLAYELEASRSRLGHDITLYVGAHDVKVTNTAKIANLVFIRNGRRYVFNGMCANDDMEEPRITLTYSKESIA